MPTERLIGFALVWIALILLASDALRGTRSVSASIPVPELT